MKKYLMLALVTAFLSLNLLASEKITDFRFEKTGPTEEVIYLVDEDGNEDYGHYIHSTNTFFSHRTQTTDYYIREHALKDETKFPYNGTLEAKELVNMSMAYNKFKFTRIVTIPVGTIGGITLLTGGALFIALAALYNDYVKGASGRTVSRIWAPADIFFFDVRASDYGPLFYAGLALMVISAMALLNFFIFLGMTIYYGNQYEASKSRLLKKLNKLVIEDRRGNEMFSLSFDFRLGN